MALHGEILKDQIKIVKNLHPKNNKVPPGSAPLSASQSRQSVVSDLPDAPNLH